MGREQSQSPTQFIIGCPLEIAVVDIRPGFSAKCHALWVDVGEGFGVFIRNHADFDIECFHEHLIGFRDILQLLIRGIGV